MYQLSPTDSSNPKMRDLPPAMRPREKLQRLGGTECLADWDLLCLVLGKGTPGHPVEGLASGLEDLLRSSPEGLPSLQELTKLKGMGEAKAGALLAGLELGRRTMVPRGRPITDPEDATPHLLWMLNERKEHFHALYLNTRRHLIASETISIGTLDTSLVHPREVFRPALTHSASAVLVAHNHPSGDPEPSIEDMILTRRLDQAATLLGFSFLDHLIVAKRGVVSLRERQSQGSLPLKLFAA